MNKIYHSYSCDDDDIEDGDGDDDDKKEDDDDYQTGKEKLSPQKDTAVWKMKDRFSQRFWGLDVV